jgi:hypothetical protein
MKAGRHNAISTINVNIRCEAAPFAIEADGARITAPWTAD